MEEYILKHHKEDIVKLLKTTQFSRKVIEINLTSISKQHEDLWKGLCRDHYTEHAKWLKALQKVKDELIKEENIEVLDSKSSYIGIDYFKHPVNNSWPKIESNLWQLIEIRGYIFRMSSPTRLELLRTVRCRLCKKETTVTANRLFNYAFTCPSRCLVTQNCLGSMLFVKDKNEEPNLEYTLKFQEFKVQEVEKYTPKDRMIIVQAENHLVNSFSIGDTVRIIGILETRAEVGSTIIKKFVFRALNMQKENLELKLRLDPKRMTNLINGWNEDRKRHNNSELLARDEMLKAVAPELIGCFGLKLALMITLCSGGKKSSNVALSQGQNTFPNREVCHLLISGVPGLGRIIVNLNFNHFNKIFFSIGKSQLMKAAMQISSRSVLTCGNSSTKAGMTASYYKEDGEYHIEAGALVLANNGMCCIDEFNLLPLTVRQAMHEAMEHQKFTLIKGKDEKFILKVH